MLRLGRLRIPLSRAAGGAAPQEPAVLEILGRQGIGCTILRVPITFPPEKFDGRLLSAMCTPDLKGTQGSFSQFTTRVERATYENGSRYPLQARGGRLRGRDRRSTGYLSGSQPHTAHSIPHRAVQRRIRVEYSRAALPVCVPANTPAGSGSGFRTAIGATANGMARFLVTETEPEFSLYMTPLHLDPERPALPISHPPYYAAYLANLLGTFATLGMAEDTWALNEGAIGEDAFLRQAFGHLRRTRSHVPECAGEYAPRRGGVRLRYQRPRAAHVLPAPGHGDPHADAIEEMYRRMDTLAGKAMAAADSGTALLVLSDHGFCAFRRGVNINAWLRDNGYLSLRNGARESGSFFEGVDWSRTRAYALGLGRILSEREGARGARHRRPPRSRGAAGRDHAQAGRAARR